MLYIGQMDFGNKWGIIIGRWWIAWNRRRDRLEWGRQ